MTLTERQLRQYRQKRAEGLGAKYALAMVKETAKPARYAFLNGFNEYGDVTGDVDGFTVHVRSTYDEDSRLGDDDVTGTFSDRYSDGAIKNTTNGENGRGYKWYLPSNYDREYAESEVRASGISKGRVAEVLRERLEQAMTDDAYRNYFGVIVTVSLDGEELADASLWGIDVLPRFDASPYLIETAEDLIGEALDQARANLPIAIARTMTHAERLTAKIDEQGS